MKVSWPALSGIFSKEGTHYSIHDRIIDQKTQQKDANIRHLEIEIHCSLANIYQMQISKVTQRCKSDIWKLRYIVVWRALSSELSCLITTQKTLYSVGSKKYIFIFKKNLSSQRRLKSNGTLSVVWFLSQFAFKLTHARCSITNN